MFGWFKRNPVAKLEARYAKKLEESRDQQRKRDVVSAAKLTAEAEEILSEIDQVEAGRN